jgi:hypothetical protein
MNENDRDANAVCFAEETLLDSNHISKRLSSYTAKIVFLKY